MWIVAVMSWSIMTGFNVPGCVNVEIDLRIVSTSFHLESSSSVVGGWFKCPAYVDQDGLEILYRLQLGARTTWL
jgi:hypothetical protein